MRLWDSIRLILKSVNYGSKTLTAKTDLQELINCVEILAEDLPNDEYELKAGFSQILFASEAIEELPDGAVSRDIQESTCALLRSIQRSLSWLLYNRYLDADVDEIIKSPAQTFVLEKMVEDHLLGNYRL